MILVAGLEVNTSLLRVEFKEDSPDILFYLGAQNSTLYKLTWRSFSEIDENAVSVNFIPFTGNLSYTTPQFDLDTKGNLIVKTNMSTVVSVGGQFLRVDVQHFFFLNSSMTTSGGEQVPVYPGNLQLFFSTRAWPFATQNRLRLLMGLTTHHLNQTEVSSSYDSKHHSLNFQGSPDDVVSLKFPTTCTIEDKEGHKTKSFVSVVVEFDNAKLSGRIDNLMGPADPQTEVAITFPSFSEVRYDTILSVTYRKDWAPFSSSLPPALGTGVLIFLCVAGVLLCMFGSLTGFLTWRRHSERRYYLRTL